MNISSIQGFLNLASYNQANSAANGRSFSEPGTSLSAARGAEQCHQLWKLSINII